MIPGFLFGFAYLVFSEAKYTAEAAVLFESPAGAFGDIGVLLLDLDTHANLIQSDAVVAAVIARLELHKKTEFRFTQGPFERLLDFAHLRLSQPLFGGVRHLDDIIATGQRDTERAAEAFQILASVPKVLGKLKVVRQGQSRILRLSFTSTDAKLSAVVTNAFAEVYLSHVSQSGPFGPKVSAPGEASGDASSQSDFMNMGDLRVVSWASVPSDHSHPKIRVVLITFTLIGFAFGLILAVLREARIEA